MKRIIELQGRRWALKLVVNRSRPHLFYTIQNGSLTKGSFGFFYLWGLSWVCQIWSKINRTNKNKYKIKSVNV